uniref:THAP-type domain-containing protein n=1 Tax=Megaselia scalaris TaxID=36166 RepID=T1H085_MEGSC
MRKCLLCRKTSIEVPLHAFPKNPAIREKWLQFCNVPEVTKSAVLCELHFKDGYRSAVSVPDCNLYNLHLLEGVTLKRKEKINDSYA